MPSRKRIARNRAKAYENQSGRCCYCKSPMWATNSRAYARTYGLTRREARQFRSTAEHKLARRDGGPNTADNIAAACYRCNHERHVPRMALDPNAYQIYVETLIAKGEWITVRGREGS
jgi:5-methylcytosine-specific restriction endonuclease McrA